jgi:hypothetical protein
MAVDTTTQKLNVATNLVAKAALLVQAYTDFQKYANVYTKAGLTYAAGDFDNTALAHVNPLDIPTLITDFESWKTWMDTAGNGDLFFKVQSGS